MRSKKILSVIMAMSLVVTSALVGCKNNSNEPNSKNNVEVSTTDNENKEENSENSNKIKMDKEQYLNLAGAEPKTLDPTVASITTSWWCQAPLYETLTRCVGTEEGSDKIEPGVAERWEGNADCTEFTFYLRKDAKWSDGDPITAKDFVYSIRRVINPETGSQYGSFFNGIIKNAREAHKGEVAIEKVGVTAVDDHTLKFELDKPIPYFLQLSYFPTLRPVKKDVIEKWGDKYGSEAEQIVGNGPFVITEWVHNGKMEFEKNPHYWDKENVYIEKMTWTVIEDTNSYLTALYNGEIDRGGTSKPEWMEKLDSTGEFNFISKKDYGVEFLVFNCNSEPFNNAKIRRAFSAAIDRQGYNDMLREGKAVPGWEFTPDTIALGNESYQKQIGYPKYAKKIMEEIKNPKELLIEGLKEAGLDEDPANLELSICMRGDGDWSKKQGEWFQQQFKEKLGVNINVELMQYQIMYDRMENLEYDMAIGGWSADFNDPSNFLDIFNSQFGYYAHDSGWKNDEYDRLTKEAGEILDAKKRAELYQKAEEILIFKEAAVAPFEHGKSSTYMRKYLKSYNPPGLAYYCMDYKGVYTDGR